MEIVTPPMAVADAVVDLWTALAEEQREVGAHLLAEPNRERVREAITSAIVADEVLVAVADAAIDADGTLEIEGDRPTADAVPDRAEGLLGFVTVGREGGGYEQAVDRGIVQNIYVRPEARDEGVGSALLAAAEDRLRELGVDAVALEAVAANDDALRFYRRHGYEPHRIQLEKPAESDTL